MSQSDVTPSQGTQLSQKDTQNDYVFSCRLDDVQSIVAILRTISFVEDATCQISASGLKVIVEQSQSLEAKAFLQAGIFQEYFYADTEQRSFRINLVLLLECLSIFGTSATATLRMTYSGYGCPLVLLLEDEGVITDCSINTSEPEDPLNIDIRSTEIPSNIIMKSQWLAEVFNDLDMTSDSVEIMISPDNPYFRISTRGNAGSSQVDCPKDSDLIEAFTCSEILIHQYNLKLIKPSEKALALSEKISIRMNAWGVLAFQYLVQVICNLHSLIV